MEGIAKEVTKSQEVPYFKLLKQVCSAETGGENGFDTLKTIISRKEVFPAALWQRVRIQYF